MSENVHYTGMSTTRVPQILEKQIIEHKSHTQIARDLEVSTKTIQRDTNTPLYETLIQGFFKKYQDKLKELLESEQVTVQLEIIKELGRMYRAGMTKTTRHTEDIKLTADLTITETRKEKDQLIKSLELTPEQYKVLENTLTTENE